ncbi:MAG: dicarboxylate/amino acid:cation symporter [Pseudomonadales bacterium]|nr:dicarboxylate/amino acid:cation symporter [Pseudomonadales bacterium]
MTLTIRILLGMLAGILVGVVVQAAGLQEAHWLQIYGINGLLDVGGQVFIRSLQLMVVPLVFVSLVCGASSLGTDSGVGRLGGKTIALYLMTTALAISVALVLALVISPGEGIDKPMDTFVPAAAPEFKQVILDIFPTNPVAAMAAGKMLQVIVFALLLGVALARSGPSGERIRAMFNDLNEVMMKLITMLIQLAPYGVFCLLSVLFSQIGWDRIVKILAYFLTVIAALLIHLTVVYSSILMLLARVNPILFISKVREPMMLAFSSASSGATMPVTLRTVEERIGVDNRVAAFAVPLGATINMDGTAIMQGVATVFIAQVWAIDLSLSQYLLVILTATMASIGTAAVPGVGLITLTMVLSQVGLPVEGIALIIGVDRLLDMMRTAVNVVGDTVVSTTVAVSENMLDRSVLNNPDAGRIIPDNEARGA